MPVEGIGAGSPAAALDKALIKTGRNDELGQQAFLKLLVTQLTNQDPLAPQDQQQFLAQLAQFSTVEGVNHMKSSQSRLQATGLLGKTIEAQVIRDYLPTTITGKVAQVRWDDAGVHLTVEGHSGELSLEEVSKVRDL